MYRFIHNYGLLSIILIFLCLSNSVSALPPQGAGIMYPAVYFGTYDFVNSYYTGFCPVWTAAGFVDTTLS